MPRIPFISLLTWSPIRVLHLNPFRLWTLVPPFRSLQLRRWISGPRFPTCLGQYFHIPRFRQWTLDFILHRGLKMSIFIQNIFAPPVTSRDLPRKPFHLPRFRQWTLDFILHRGLKVPILLQNIFVPPVASRDLPRKPVHLPRFRRWTLDFILLQVLGPSTLR